MDITLLSRLMVSVLSVGSTVPGRMVKPYVDSDTWTTHLTKYTQWYRNRSYLYDGKYTDLDNFIRSEWEAGFLANWDANDMLTLMRTWWKGDVSHIASVAPDLQGNLTSVLSSIGAKSLIMPCKTDLYFPVSPLSELPNVSHHVCSAGR